MFVLSLMFDFFKLFFIELGKYISHVEGKLKEQSNDLHETEKKLKLTETELKFSEEAKLELNYKVSF